MQQHLVGTEYTSVLSPRDRLARRQTVRAERVIVEYEQRRNEMGRTSAAPFDVGVLRGKHATAATQPDKSLILSRAALAALPHSPKLVVTRHPDQLLETWLQDIEGELKIRFGFAYISGQNEPIVTMIIHSYQGVAVRFDGCRSLMASNFTMHLPMDYGEACFLCPSIMSIYPANSTELSLFALGCRQTLPSDAPPLDPSVLASLLGPRFVVSVATPRSQDNQLFPDELQHVARAVEKRREEFGTARVCARRALAQLGLAPCSLVPNWDGSPRWPPGIKGSISHTKDCCAVVVTSAPDVIGLGIDIEEDTPLLAELVPMICTPEEQRWTSAFGRDARGYLTKLIFSAKEAFYKCQYEITRTLIDFQEVQLSIDLASGAFSVSGIKREGPQWSCVRRACGKFRRDSGFVVTTTLLTSNTAVLT